MTPRERAMYEFTRAWLRRIRGVQLDTDPSDEVFPGPMPPGQVGQTTIEPGGGASLQLDTGAGDPPGGPSLQRDATNIVGRNQLATDATPPRRGGTLARDASAPRGGALARDASAPRSGASLQYADPFHTVTRAVTSRDADAFGAAIALNAAVIGALQPNVMLMRNISASLQQDETPIDLYNLALIDSEELTLGDTIQGAAYDGTHHYVSTSTILYKFSRDAGTGAYTEVASRDVSGDLPSGVTQINGMNYHNGSLWVGGNNFAVATQRSWLFEFDPSDLSLIASHEITTAGEGWSEGGAWRNGEYWAVFHDLPRAYRYSYSGGAFTLVASYPLPLVEGLSNNLYQNAAWFGNVLITQTHSNNGERTQTHFHRWTGSQFHPVHSCAAFDQFTGQGLHWETASTPADSDVLLFAKRTTTSAFLSRGTFRVMASEGSTTPYDDAVIADEPLAYWPLLDTFGDSMTELAHITRPGRYSGSLAFGGDAFTEDDDAGSVDFSGGVGEFPDDPLVSGLTAISIEAWFEADDLTQRAIVSKHLSGTTGEWYVAIVDASTVRFSTVNQAGVRDDFDVTFALSTGIQYHLVCTYDGTTKRVYLAARGDAISEIDNKAVAMTNLQDSAQPIRVGRISSATWPFDGRIGNVAIYAEAISLSRIQAHHTAAGSA